MGKIKIRGLSVINNQQVDEAGDFFDGDFVPRQGNVPMDKIRGRLGRREDGIGDKYPGKNGRNARSGVPSRS